MNGERHFGKAFSKVSTTDLTAAMAKELSVVGTCLAIARTTDYFLEYGEKSCIQNVHGLQVAFINHRDDCA